MLVAIAFIIICLSLIFLFLKNKKTGLPTYFFPLLFSIKVICGFTLTYIYSNHYKDRSTADIFKYYDDAKVMYSALKDEPLDYFKMISGVGNNTFHFDTCYYEKMNHWYKRNDFGMYNDNHTIIRFNALLMPFTFNSFHAHTVIMCFISLIGFYFLFQFFLFFLSDKEKWIAIVVFFLPSVLFWGSGLLKEGLLIFSIGSLLYGFLLIFIRKHLSILNLLIFLFGILLLLLNKTYWLVLLILPLSCLYITLRYSIKKTFLFFMVYHLLFFVLGFIFYNAFENKSLLKTISERQQAFINLAKGGIYLLNQENLVRLEPDESKSLIKASSDSVFIKEGSNYLKWKLNNFDDTLFVKNSGFSEIKFKVIAINPKAGSLLFDQAIVSDFGSFMLFIPKAIINCLLMPLPWNVNSVTELMASVENILIFLTLIGGFFFYRKNIPQLNSFCCFLIFVSMLCFLVVGFTTPVAGAIVRYKMPALPFLLMIVVYFSSKKKTTEL